MPKSTLALKSSVTRRPAAPPDMAERLEQLRHHQAASAGQESIAWALVNTPIQAAITANAYLKEPFTDCLDELTTELQRKVKAVNKGDMRSLEGLLVQQAHTLNFIFHRLAQRAQVQEDSRWFDLFLRLGLRAQALPRK